MRSAGRQTATKVLTRGFSIEKGPDLHIQGPVTLSKRSKTLLTSATAALSSLAGALASCLSACLATGMFTGDALSAGLPRAWIHFGSGFLISRMSAFRRLIRARPDASLISCFRCHNINAPSIYFRPFAAPNSSQTNPPLCNRHSAYIGDNSGCLRTKFRVYSRVAFTWRHSFTGTAATG